MSVYVQTSVHAYEDTWALLHLNEALSQEDDNQETTTVVVFSNNKGRSEHKYESERVKNLPIYIIKYSSDSHATKIFGN